MKLLKLNQKLYLPSAEDEKNTSIYVNIEKIIYAIPHEDYLLLRLDNGLEIRVTDTLEEIANIAPMHF